MREICDQYNVVGFLCVYCFNSSHLIHFFLHSTVVHNYARNWNMSSKFCKTHGKAYLSGDVPTTDVHKACEFIERKATGPTWLGIAKEKYISMDGGI